MFEFITKRPLWANILAAAALVVILLFVFVYSLNFITKHGKSKNVPDVVGKKTTDARQMLSKEGFDMEVVDSVYIDTLPHGAVIRQVPEGDAVVKIDRTVYVTINRSVPPFIEMPNLVGYSLRSALLQMSNMGLRLGDTTFVPDFAKNSVKDMRYKGESIKPGTKIQMGSTISLVLGDGVGELEFPVPDIVGMRFEDAKHMLEGNGVTIGSIIPLPGITDTLNAYIYQQRPQRFDDEGKREKLRSGQMMDVWLQAEKPVQDSSSQNQPLLLP